MQSNNILGTSVLIQQGLDQRPSLQGHFPQLKGGIINVLKVMCIVRLFATTGAVLRCTWTGFRYLELLDWKCNWKLKTSFPVNHSRSSSLGFKACIISAAI